MNLSDIQELVKLVAKNNISEVAIEQKDFKITIKSDKKSKEAAQQPIVIQAPAAALPVAPAVGQPVAAPAPAAPVASTPAVPASDDSKYVTVKSPMIGTFYRSPEPGKPAFVEVGTNIKKGDTVCVIEAMKLFNEIESEVVGKIVKVLVDDASPVEYDQPLFLVDPA